MHRCASRDGQARVELDAIVRRHGQALRAQCRLSTTQERALRAIERCRSAALGGQLLRCERCGAQQYRFHSCRNRHCPKCQSLARERWLAAQRADLLPVGYFHLVFTLPEPLRPLCMGNPRALYALLFRTVTATLQAFGADPRWLGGEIGATLLLHTWTQKLDYHPHVHVLLPGGALAGHTWIGARRAFLFPVQALSKCFRGKFLAGLDRLFTDQRLRLAGSTAPLAQRAERLCWFAQLRSTAWVVYAKASLAAPEQVLDYLARYTHRTALSNERILSVDDTSVRLSWRDRAHGNRRRVLYLAPLEFLARFVRHVLPAGFTRIRHIGFLASRRKRDALQAAREALNAPAPAPVAMESAEAYCLRVIGIDLHQCPVCQQGRLILVETLAPTVALRGQPP